MSRRSSESRCFNIADGISTAGPASVRGKDVRTLKDATDKLFGDELYKAAQDGKITEGHLEEWRRRTRLV